MNISFFEDLQDRSLFPLTLTRPSAHLRIGIMTIAGKWIHRLNASSWGFETREYLQPKFPSLQCPADLRISGNVIPTPALVQAVLTLTADQALVSSEGQLIAVRSSNTSINASDYTNQVVFSESFSTVKRPYHIFKWNAQEITLDFDFLTQGRTSVEISATNQIIGKHPIFFEEGAKAECCIFNTQDGPIYIGKNAQVMEGSIIRGPFAMGEGSNVKLGTKIYPGTSLGPYCNVGGELNNVVMHGYSNKGHDGFLGNAVLGEWCNIGADTNCSNLKNTYEEVKVWNYHNERFDKSGEQFCGLIMGDHSKCGINTMFNTGTVVGVGCNIFGAGFPRQFIQDFSWGGAQGIEPHKIPQFEKTAKLVMQRRGKEYSEAEQNIMRYVSATFGVG
jgi:UDP-N-acetylglucosamine diphosphorylase/glucosamine-1-phosphate N-acetyltransferase